MLPKKESLTVEFKSDLKGLPDRVLAEEVLAMANSEGGDIYVGIEDDGTVTGANQGHLDPFGARAVIANLTVPTVNVEAEIIVEEGLPILHIHVPLSNEIVSSASGRTLQRKL